MRWPLTFKYRFAAALPCAAALLLAGCATPCNPMVDSGRYSLVKGVPVQISPDARLTLVAVEDSRCPDGVQCIWAGRINYQFELQSCGRTERFVLPPIASTPAPGSTGQPTYHTLSLAPAMRVTLAAGEPPPRGAAAASPVQGVDVIIDHG